MAASDSALRRTLTCPRFARSDSGMVGPLRDLVLDFFAGIYAGKPASTLLGFGLDGYIVT
jgi:hypothetical protein